MLEWLQLIVSGLGLFAVVWSLVMVRNQLRESNHQTQLLAASTRAEVYSTVLSLEFEWDRFVADNPDLRPLLYDGAPFNTEGTQRSVALAAAEMFLDMVDGVEVLSKCLDDYDWNSWRAYVQSVFDSSDLIQNYYRDNCQWYPKSLQRFLPQIEMPVRDA